MTKWISRKTDKRGFSLVELLVAVTLMGIGFLGVVALFPLGNQTVSESGMHTTAIELAQQGLENLLDLPYNDELLDPSSEHVEQMQVGEKTYYIDWKVTSDMPVTDCKTVVYTVKWDEEDESRQLAVTGVIARAGRE